MSVTCNFEGCTVDETGTCALERDPAKCEHRVGALQNSDSPSFGEKASANGSTNLGAPVLRNPNAALPFPSSRTLGPDIISSMMTSRHVTVVGILGDPESGKTACLTSLYLMIANGTLDGWAFGDSKSLMGFEEIARGAREWNQGEPPEQMTVHTDMADDRRPGFLHLRLIRKSDGRQIDLALPDLPGEWTTDLVTTARADRFEFIKSAEAIWIVVDGGSLTDKETCQGAIARLGQLVGRLKTITEGDPPNIIIVITRRDQCDLDARTSARMLAELAKRDVVVKLLPVAPFSVNANVKPGFGIAELIDVTVGSTRPAPQFWPDSSPSGCQRAYLGFRRGS